MRRIDDALIYHVCKLVNGANTHAINTCLHRYETAKTAKIRARYEGTLRQFVAESNALAALQAQTEFLRRRSKELNDISDFLARKIDELPFIRPKRT